MHVRQEASGVQQHRLRAILNPLAHPICVTLPKRLTPYSAWHEHIPFAMFLVDILRPAVIVELGTQYGDSYCAFCQAVKELNLNTRCYAIDTWEGDVHTGVYGSEVLADLRGHHDPLYRGFSNLLQSSFEDALAQFADGTIDILHIDGCHAYEAVKRDFESWFPKVSSRGVILLHDTNVLKSGFGVKRLWSEIESGCARFEFLHGSGLGVLARHRADCPELIALVTAADEAKEQIRDFFFQLGHRLTIEVDARAAVATLESEMRQLQRHVEQLQGHLEGMMNSRSWKVTTPLRGLSSGLRSVRERLTRCSAP